MVRALSENKTLIKNTGLIAIGNLGAKAASFLLLPLYTSILSTEEYGTFDYIVTISAFLIPVFTLTVNEAMFRFVLDVKNAKDEFVSIITNSFVIQMIGSLVLALVMLCVSIFYSPENCLYLWLYVTGYALYAFSTYLLRGIGKTKNYALISFGKTLLQLLLNIFAIAVLRLGLRGLLLSLCISEVLAFLVVFFTNRLWENIRFAFISKATIKKMTKYSFPLIFNNISSQIINLSDRLMISWYMGAAANGIYAISYKFPNVVQTVYHFFYLAWNESASRIIVTGKERAQKHYRSLFNILDHMVFSIIILLIAGMAIIYRVLVKGDYLQGFTYIPILMLSMYFHCISMYFAGIFTALKKTKILAASTCIGAIINILINIIFIQRFGLYAAAVSTLIAEIVVFILRGLSLRKEMSIRITPGNIIQKIVTAIIILYLYSYTNWNHIIGSIILAAAYFVFTNRKLILRLIHRKGEDD